MIPKRKIYFQFAALADLLLVMVFLLYLQMSQGVEKEKSESAQGKANSLKDYNSLLENNDNLKKAINNANARLLDEKDRADSLANDIKQISNDYNALKLEYGRLSDKNKLDGEKNSSLQNDNKALQDKINALQNNVANLGNKNNQIINSTNSTLTALADFVNRIQDQDIKNVTSSDKSIGDALKKFGNNDMGAVAAEIQRIITMTQQMDVFEIYIDSSNIVNIKNPSGKTQSISIGDVDNQEKCKIDIQNQLINYMKNQPQLKKLAVLMIIHGNCGFLHRKIVQESLDSCKGQIKQLSANNPEIFVTAPLFIDKEKK